jgi:hypothetical protein
VAGASPDPEQIGTDTGQKAAEEAAPKGREEAAATEVKEGREKDALITKQPCQDMQ